MKNILIIFVVIGITIDVAFCQTKSDTTFILRENGEYYHAIFIDNNKNSSFYTDLEKNISSPFDSSLYFENIQALRKNDIKISRHKINNISKNWKLLYLYKGKYYVYYPSDGMYNNWIDITDSIFLFYAGGEMIVSAISNFRQITSKEFQFRLTEDYGKVRKINIYIIDKKRGIAVFEYAQKNGQYKYELRVATNKIRNFPIIINYCEVQKQDEFDFDKPNYKRLIKK